MKNDTDAKQAAKFAKHPVMASIRKALGRKKTPEASEVPTPPVLDEPLIRLVHTDFGLPALFAKKAEENKMHVHWVSPEEAAPAIVAKAQELGVKSMVFPQAPLLRNLEIPPALIGAGINVHPWDSTTLDATYDIDAGLTDAWAAVAETGSIVVQPSAAHGRSVSLVPNIHFVVLEPKVFVPDLVDLFEKLAKSDASATTIITGPSKTADIELNLVTGVHGPGQVEVFILR